MNHSTLARAGSWNTPARIPMDTCVSAGKPPGGIGPPATRMRGIAATYQGRKRKGGRRGTLVSFIRVTRPTPARAAGIVETAPGEHKRSTHMRVRQGIQLTYMLTRAQWLCPKEAFGRSRTAGCGKGVCSCSPEPKAERSRCKALASLTGCFILHRHRH